MKPVSEQFTRQEEKENAAAIGFELDVLADALDKFGWRSTDDKDVALRVRHSEDWVSKLRKYDVRTVREGISNYKDWRAKEIHAGRNLKNMFPTASDIEVHILERRKVALQNAPAEPSKKEPPRQELTATQRAQRKAFADRVREEAANRK